MKVKILVDCKADGKNVKAGDSPDVSKETRNIIVQQNQAEDVPNDETAAVDGKMTGGKKLTKKEIAAAEAAANAKTEADAEMK
jgi:hypothetical protein